MYRIIEKLSHQKCLLFSYSISIKAHPYLHQLY